MAERALEDPNLGPWLVARLEELDTVGISAKTKAAKLSKLDAAIGKATAELREASKAEALAESERQFAGEAA